LTNRLFQCIYTYMKLVERYKSAFFKHRKVYIHLYRRKS